MDASVWHVPTIYLGGYSVRKLSTLVAPAVALGVTMSIVPVGASHAARTVPAPLFGQHIGAIATASPATLSAVGSVRLWDSRVAWRQLQREPGAPNLAPLAQAVSNIEAKYGAGVEITYTLGSPPQWAAAVKDSKYALYGPGSNSHPADDQYYLDFLAAVATTFKGRIDAYQIWNEANLKDFYIGTPAQLAALTKKAAILLDSIDPGAKVIAASTTVRSKGPVNAFGKAFGPAMKKAGAWRHVDAVSAHFYPPATKGPAERVKYIKKIKKYYKRWGAGKKPLWDAEMNYGDTRSYMKVKRQYTGATAATYVARTFIDSMRYGVARVHWYGWDIHVLGTDMTSRSDGSLTAGGQAFLQIQDWMAGKAWYGCKSRASITTCTVGAPGSATGKATIRYAAKKRTLKMTTGSWQIRRLDGSSEVVGKGAKVALTSQPILITRVG